MDRRRGAPPAAAVDAGDLLRALYEESADGVLVTDAAGAVLAANARAEVLAGRPGGLAGAALLDLFAPPAGGGPAAGLDGLCLPGAEGPDRALRGPGGAATHVDLSCRRLPGDRLLWTLRDATARRRSELEVWMRSEAVESSLNGIALAGLDGRLTYVNGAFVRMWGLSSAADAAGRHAASFWDEPEKAGAILGRVLEGQSAVGDLVGRRPNGERFFVELSAAPVRDAAGLPVALVGSFVDTTARTRAAEALREGEERLRQAVRVAELGIFDNDLAAGVIHWSARMREIFDVAPDEPVTMPLMLSRVHPDDRAAVAAAIARAEDAGGEGRYDVDCRLAHRDGSLRHVSVRARVFFEGEGGERRAVRRVGACRDVTEAVLAGAERDRLRAQLEHAQRLESVGRLAGGVAHDFNNMLAVILGNAEVMRDRGTLTPEAAADLAEIEQAARHARDVTRQLLAFSRKQVVSPRALDLNEEVERARRTLARLVGEDVAFSVHLSPGLWRVSLDPLQVDQVLMNLAVNARDAMPGGGRLTLETANVQLDQAYCRQHPEFRPGDHVLLTVSDSGVGMDRETARHIFEPFFTTKGPGKGTGLGLATVYGIVNQAGGSIHVYSEPAQGTTFRIYFPRHRGEGEVVREVEPPAVVAGGTVLLVEDDAMVRRMATSMLASLGVAVVAASGPAEAIAIVASGAPPLDLVLTDVVMPEMNGRALRDRLQALRPGLPVVFMSGYTPNVIVHHGVLDEGVRLLQKPFTLGELAAAVGEALRAARPGGG